MLPAVEICSDHPIGFCVASLAWKREERRHLHLSILSHWQPVLGEGCELPRVAITRTTNQVAPIGKADLLTVLEVRSQNVSLLASGYLLLISGIPALQEHCQSASSLQGHFPGSSPHLPLCLSVSVSIFSFSIRALAILGQCLP
jgi:hypothetical protein